MFLVASVIALLERVGMTDLGGLLWTWPVLFLVLGLCHEGAHVAALYLLGGQLASTSADTEGVHLGFVTLGARRDVAVVLAGPAGAASLGVDLSAVALVLGAPPMVSLGVMAVGVGHLVSLLVSRGDGLELRILLGRPVEVDHTFRSGH